MILISVGELDDLATVTVLLLLAVFALVNVAVLVLRSDRVEEPHFVAPAIFPVLGLVISLVLLVKRVTDEDRTVVWIALALLGAGALLWLVNRLVSGPTRDVDPSSLNP
jgi:amino acid transporter